MTDASRKQEDHSNPLSQPENLNSRSTIQEWSETRSREAAHGKAPPGSSRAGLRIARTWSSAKRLAWTGTSARAAYVSRMCPRGLLNTQHDCDLAFSSLPVLSLLSLWLSENDVVDRGLFRQLKDTS